MGKKDATSASPAEEAAASGTASSAPAAKAPSKSPAKKGPERERDGRAKRGFFGHLWRFLILIPGIGGSLYIVMDSFYDYPTTYFPKIFGECLCHSKFNDERYYCFPQDIPDVISPSEAKWLVESAEKASKKYEWQSNRFNFDDTQEVPAGLLPKEAKEFVMDSVVPQMLSEASSRCMFDPADVYPLQVDVLKFNYDEKEANGGRYKGMGFHQDNYYWSFMISLSEITKDYRGGGTQFTHLDIENKTHKMPIGGGMVFGSGLEHRGLNVEEGSRYMLAGNFNLRCCYWVQLQRNLAALSALFFFLILTWWYIPDYDVIETKRHGVKFVKKTN